MSWKWQGEKPIHFLTVSSHRRYLYREYKNIDRLTDEEFLSVTKFPWGPLPDFKDVNKKIRAGKGQPSRLWPEDESDQKE